VEAGSSLKVFLSLSARRLPNARRQRPGPRNGGPDLDADWKGAVPVRCTPWLGFVS